MNYRKIVAIVALIASAILPCLGLSQQWGQFGGNAQHTGLAQHGIQALGSVLWSTPLDTNPPYSGGALLIHYGTPTISNGGAVALAVRTGGGGNFPTVDDTYTVEVRNLDNGALIYSESSDFTDWMPHDWTPSFGPVIDSNDTMYYPGAGGTIWKKSNVNSSLPAPSQLCFYGITNYNANPSAYNAAVQIDTPITVDSQNNVYFGFYVAQPFDTDVNNAPGIKNGIAEISAAGVGSWVAIDTITGDSGDVVQFNCAPAVSNDGTELYVASHGVNSASTRPKLVRISTASLTNAAAFRTVNLTIPVSTPVDPSSAAYVMDDGTACPMIGSDGDVYFGVWYLNILRGFMLHYSGDFSTKKLAGAFGWDDTATLVPSSIVPGYSGTSSYLICTKYNNYADDGAYGDGANRIAILDPNASETYTIQYGNSNPGGVGVMVGDNAPGTTTGASYTTMKEILTVLGVTANTELNGENQVLEGVREWCVNSVAIDVPGKGALVNSEDGHSYRWDFASNSLTQVLNLEPPTGEAYTMTLASNDGIAFAVNNSTLFAMWDGARPGVILPPIGGIAGGSVGNCVLDLTANASGPGAVAQLTSSNPSVASVPASVTVPSGSKLGGFTVSTSPVSSDTTVTITASRYGFTAHTNIVVKEAAVSSVNFLPGTIVGGNATTATVRLASTAAPSGDTATITGAGPALLPHTLNITGSSASFSVPTIGVTSATLETVVVTVGTSTKLGVISVLPATLLSVTFSPNTLIGGVQNSLGVLNLNGEAGPLGTTASLLVFGPLTTPISVRVPTNARSVNFTAISHAVTLSTFVTVRATFNGATVTGTVLVLPLPVANFTLSSSSIPMTYGFTGTIRLGVTVSTPITLNASDNNGRIVIDTQPVVPANSNVATFTGHALQLPFLTGLQPTSSVTVSGFGAFRSQGVVIDGFGLLSATVSPGVLFPGQSANLTITSELPAGAIPLSVGVSSSSTLVMVPSTASIAAGSNKAIVRITAASFILTPRLVTLYVSMSGTLRLVNVQLEP